MGKLNILHVRQGQQIRRRGEVHTVRQVKHNARTKLGTRTGCVLVETEEVTGHATMKNLDGVELSIIRHRQFLLPRGYEVELVEEAEAA